MNLEGKIALITGGSRGIGKAITIELAKLGCNVVINYHNSMHSALVLADEITKNYGVKALAIKCDVSSEKEVKWMIDSIIKDFEKIDILVNNAAISHDNRIEDKSVLEFQEVLSVNLIGTFLVSKYVGAHMYNKKTGRIINIASTNAINTNYKESMDYDASKAGVLSLTSNLAKEYAPYVLVNAVCPGWVETEMNKELSPLFRKNEEAKILLERFAKPEEIAHMVTFLASDLASYINGTTIRVDGGYS